MLNRSKYYFSIEMLNGLRETAHAIAFCSPNPQTNPISLFRHKFLPENKN